MQTYIIILLISISVICAITFITAYITYRMTFYRKPSHKISNPYHNIDKGGGAPYVKYSTSLIDTVLSMDHEDVYIKSRDGLTLHGKYYKKADGLPFAIQFHGYKSTPMKDFSGAGVMCLDFGYNVIMIEQRAHEKSDGNTICFGEKEKYDVISWVNYVIERFGKDTNIVLQGISMGAATVILASALSELPENVKATMADCPYSSTKAIIKKVINDMKLPSTLLYPFVRLGAVIFGGFDPNKTDVAKAASSAKIPILLVHGKEDSFVPYYMGEEISKSEKVIFHSFDGADHGISFLLDEERYRRIAKEFMDQNAKKDKGE